jgi:hemoglobin/transferrin/lactoferrin receptor protein
MILKKRAIGSAAVLLLLGAGVSSAEEDPNQKEKQADAEESASEELEDMVVVATRTKKSWIDSSGTVLKTDAEELLKLGSQDLAGFAKYDPTVSLPFDFTSSDGAYGYGQSGYGSINIRGAEGNRIAIELDGVRQPPQYVSTSFDQSDDAGAGGIGRDYYDPAMFEMVEVLKGGASALYGSDAMGGVVSFTTPDPEDLLSGNSTGGLLRSQYFSVNQSVALQTGGAFRVGNTSGLLLFANRQGEETENNGKLEPNPVDFESNSLLLKMDHVIGAHAFRVAFEAFERRTDIDAISATESDFSVFDGYVRNKQTLERLRGSLYWDYDANAKWIDRLEAHLYTQHARSTSDNESATEPISTPFGSYQRLREQTIQFDTDIVGLSLLSRKEWGDANTLSNRLVIGFDSSFEQGENRFERIENGVSEDKISYAPTDTTRAGLYVQDEITLLKNWSVTAGLRVDYQQVSPDPNQAYLDRLASLGQYTVIETPEEYENLSLAPRLNIAWKPTDWLQWYGSYSRGVRNPNGEELSMIFAHPTSGAEGATGTLTVPNPDLKEETSDAFEVGLKGEGDLGRFQVSGFYTRYTDYIDGGFYTGERDDEGREIVTTVNRGKTDIYGFEMAGSLKLERFISPAIGWEVGLSTGKSVGIDREKDAWINSIEPWKTVAYLGYDDPEGRFGARLTGIYTDEVTRVDDETNQGEFYRPPAWGTMDFAIYWRPQETLTIHAGVNNIFDRKYWSWGSVRRGGGHLGGDTSSDRTTAPGRNWSISLTKTF